MKREDVLKILEDQTIDNDARISQILNLNGSDLNSHKKRYEDLEKLYKDMEAQKKAAEDGRSAELEKFKDYDAILRERDELKAEKAERGNEDRFKIVLGDKKPKNDFTRRGLYEQFKAETLKEENNGKDDAAIFKSIIDGKEMELFDSPVKINMTPINPTIKTPSSDEAYLDEYYKNNPYYKRN